MRHRDIWITGLFLLGMGAANQGCGSSPAGGDDPQSGAGQAADSTGQAAVPSGATEGSGQATASGGGSSGDPGAPAPAGQTGSPPAQGGPGSPPAPPPATSQPVIGGCTLFPADNPWNHDVSADPVDPNSAAYISAMNGATRYLHPDFGSDPSYGIPWVSVPSTQPQVAISFTYAGESDPGPYPFPPNAPIEVGDRHVLVLQQGACKLYETYNSYYNSPSWHADSGARFDLTSDALRPEGWTSADAAGLPILPGLVRKSEIDAGAINHALRFTVAHSQSAHVHPATHSASSSTSASLPPMGLRVRLKASYDISMFTGASRVILAAMKKYGMFLADNGSDWFVSGERNTAWSDSDLAQLKKVPASAFEVVKLGTIYRP